MLLTYSRFRVWLFFLMRTLSAITLRCIFVLFPAAAAAAAAAVYAGGLGSAFLCPFVWLGLYINFHLPGHVIWRFSQQCSSWQGPNECITAADVVHAAF